MERMVVGALVLAWVSSVCMAQVPIPPKMDGFVYEKAMPKEDSIAVEAFFDPLCPDSRDSWPPLKQIFHDYYPRISVTVHPFPLPYHTNAFVACRALHIANTLNSSVTYQLLEAFFSNQGKFYNSATLDTTERAVIRGIAKLAANTMGGGRLPAILAGFEDAASATLARVSFRNGCTRGVAGTPYFFVNGFLLAGGGSPIPYFKWKSIIDQLIGKK